MVVKIDGICPNFKIAKGQGSTYGLRKLTYDIHPGDWK